MTNEPEPQTAGTAVAGLLHSDSPGTFRRDFALFPHSAHNHRKRWETPATQGMLLDSRPAAEKYALNSERRNCCPSPAFSVRSPHGLLSLVFANLKIKFAFVSFRRIPHCWRTAPLRCLPRTQGCGRCLPEHPLGEAGEAWAGGVNSEGE